MTRLTLALPFCILLLAFIGFGIVGCANSTQFIPQSVLTDLNASVASTQNVVTALSTSTPPTLDPATAAKLEVYINDAKNVLAALSSADAANPANAGQLQAAVNDLSAVLMAVSNVPGIPAQYAQILTAITIVIPVIEAVVEQIDPSLIPAPVAPASTRMHATPMSLHNARVILGEPD